MALILNELLTNALRHGDGQAAPGLPWPCACDANGARLDHAETPAASTPKA
jgi:hypothetical protein